MDSLVPSDETGMEGLGGPAETRRTVDVTWGAGGGGGEAARGNEDNHEVSEVSLEKL